MTLKIISTDTLCKNCGADIYNAVCQRVFEGAGGFFDFECPVCNTVFSVDVEPVPSFKFIAAAQHSVNPTKTRVGQNYQVRLAEVI